MPRSSSVIPCLRFADPDAALDFLKRAFGFDERLVARDGDGRIVHAELVLGGGMIMIGPADRALHDWRLAREAGCVTASIHVLVDDADAHHARAAAAGAAILEAPADPPYGGREYVARDGEGNLWSFSTYDPWAAES
jgi:uncharacterized glyoxalase superfamily protein PhnB